MFLENFPKGGEAPSGESLDKSREEEVEKEALEDLKGLGLDFDYLKGKLILDIGAGPGVIAEVAKKEGIKVISLDINPEMWTEEGIKMPDVPYVKADAENLPFADETFDLIISHAGPLILSSSKEKIAVMIQEAKRVLKEGGEIRFGPGNLNANIFTTEELFTPEEEESFTTEQRIQRIGQKSLEFLKTIDSNINQKEIKESSRDYPSKTFYVLIKPKTEKQKNNL
jgi:ubiquinone/menaquinone biosynthesis C-methylase UbiE